MVNSLVDISLTALSSPSPSPLPVEVCSEVVVVDDGVGAGVLGGRVDCGGGVVGAESGVESAN